MADIRVSTGFFGHYKTRKLERELGSDGVVAFLKLWAFCADTKARTDGSLEGMSDDDIEIAADWRGSSGALTGLLVAIGYLDGDEGNRCIHDWGAHQPYVAQHGSRSRSAKRAADARWKKARGNPEKARTFNAQRIATHCDPHAERNAPSPDPDPSPDPKNTLPSVECADRPVRDGLNGHESKTLPEETLTLVPSVARSSPSAVVALWNRDVAPLGPKAVRAVNEKRAECIRRLSKQRFRSLDDWQAYFQTFAEQSWALNNLQFDFVIKSTTNADKILERVYERDRQRNDDGRGDATRLAEEALRLERQGR